MPSTIQVSTVIADDNQLQNEYDELKLASIAEIEQATQKGTNQIDIALSDIQNEYDAILINWDKTKTDLELETKEAIDDMSHMMTDTKVLVDDHAKITENIKRTKSDIATMNTDMTTIIGTVKMMVTQATEDLIASAEDDILDKNHFYLQNMDETFAENIDLMQQLHSTSTSDIKTTTSIATDKAIATFLSEKDICMKM